MASTKAEQRTNLKFLAKLKKSPSECLKLLQEVYGDNAMSRTRVFEWHKRFADGREKVEDDESPDRPVTATTEENIAKINAVVRNDRRLSIQMIAEMVNLDKETVRQILHEQLNMRKVCAKLVPRNLNAPAHNTLSVKQFLADKKVPGWATLLTRRI
ncbi:protein GVQW3-like [Ornithodoros turicata]|uniref:protein GVQW3-like n=1 Tax=Ornithodoros turicata TaxID=34597 RepID=UPI003139DCAE